MNVNCSCIVGKQAFMKLNYEWTDDQWTNMMCVIIWTWPTSCQKLGSSRNNGGNSLWQREGIQLKSKIKSLLESLIHLWPSENQKSESSTETWGIEVRKIRTFPVTAYKSIPYDPVKTRL